MAEPKKVSIEQMMKELRERAVGPREPFDPVGDTKRNLAGIYDSVKAIPGNMKRMVQDPVAYIKNLPAPTGDQIMNAIGPGNLGMAGIMIGPKAKTWNVEKAKMAIEMEKAGKSPEDIWYATGTYRAPEGGLRQEISDSNAVHRSPADIQSKVKKMRDEQDTLKYQAKESVAHGKEVVSDLFPKEALAARKAAKQKVSSINDDLDGFYGLKQDPKNRGNYLRHGYEHPELYAAYPELQNYVLRQGNSSNYLGSINGSTVNLSQSGLARSPTSTLAHEMQHGVQGIEGTPRGGNLYEFMEARSKAQQALNQTQKDMIERADLITSAPDIPSRNAWAQDYARLQERRNKLRPHAALDPERGYKLLGGEAESRAVQARLNMTPEERANTYPLNSYDENPKQLRFLDQGEVIDIYKADGGSVNKPKSTVKAYKLFRVHPKHPGKLFPLFVDSNTPVEMNKWVDAKEGDMKDGKVKSKIGALAYRPGWHAGDLPIATHIGEKSDPDLTAPDRRSDNHAWAEVEMPNDVDWQTEANKRGTNAEGKIVPVKAHITDQIPKGGHYRYKTNPNMTGNWLIGGSMKVNKVLTDKEVERINSKAGMADLPRHKPFERKKFGFAQGGFVAPEEWAAEEYVNHKAKGGRVTTHDIKLTERKL